MLFDMVQRSPRSRCSLRLHTKTPPNTTLAKDSPFNAAVFPRLQLAYKLLGDRLAIDKDSPHASLQYSGYTAVQIGAIGE
jgi:hypothetical protein|tara:strand:- start:436 stop:675 length:240 start_codon:yes stop_codon:yes gene_type:complete